MKESDFQRERAEWTEKRFVLCDEKAKDYIRNDDRFDNFKRLGETFDIDPMKVLGIYLHKHWDSIVRYVKTEGKETYSEPVEGRIGDLQNYLDILFLMILEKKEIK